MLCLKKKLLAWLSMLKQNLCIHLKELDIIGSTKTCCKIFQTLSKCWTYFISFSKFVYVFTNPSARVGSDTKSIFNRSLTGLIKSFLLDRRHSKIKELSLTNYFPIAAGRIVRVIPFPRVFLLCEKKTVSSRIWTRITVFIFYVDNHYTTSTCKFTYCRIWI